jgi:hypothetical protein
MTNEEVLSKVRKLFELANSPNENEAALAAAKARQLLSAHNLSMADLPAEDVKASLHATEQSVNTGKIVRNWVKGLLIHVAYGFDCEHIIRRSHGADPVLSFIGAPADAEVAVYTFRFLYAELSRMAERAIPTLKRENRGWSTVSLKYAYLDGAVSRVGGRLREETRRIKVAEQGECKALVLVKEDLIRDYMARTFPRITKEYGRRRAISVDAFNRGYSDAEGIALRPGLNKGTGQSAITG